MDELEKVESYRALYRVRPLIYHIGDIRLWMPIRQDGVVLWLVYIVVFFVFCYVLPILTILPFDRVITMAVGPIAAAYYTVKLDPAGKTLPLYLQDILYFLVRPKWVVRWQAIRQPGGKTAIHFTGYCRPYERIPLPQHGEEWRGRREKMNGTVWGLQSMFLPSHIRFHWVTRKGRLSIMPLKRPSRHAIVPPELLEGNRFLKGNTVSPIQLELEKRENHKENWKVSAAIIPFCRGEERTDEVSRFVLGTEPAI